MITPGDSDTWMSLTESQRKLITQSVCGLGGGSSGPPRAGALHGV